MTQSCFIRHPHPLGLSRSLNPCSFLALEWTALASYMLHSHENQLMLLLYLKFLSLYKFQLPSKIYLSTLGPPPRRKLHPFAAREKRCPVESDRFPSDNPINQRAARKAPLYRNPLSSNAIDYRYFRKAKKQRVLARSRSQFTEM